MNILGDSTSLVENNIADSNSRRNSRPHNLHLEIGAAISHPPPPPSPLNLLPHTKSADGSAISGHVSSSRSDSSSRCSTPTPSIASSTDESSIATPTLEAPSVPPTFTFSPPDNATRILLRDRYLESQRPIIVGSNNSLEIPRSAYREEQQKKNGQQLLEIFTPPETPSSRGKEVLEINKSIPPPKLLLDRTGEGETKLDWCNSDSDMGVETNFREVEVEMEEEDEEVGILEVMGSYELDDPSQPTKLGSGAWSNVYKGYLRRSQSEQNPVLVAVKRPLNTFSIPALRREAGILSYIHRRVSASPSYQSIITFQGFDASTTSLLMTCLSGENLEQFTTRSRLSQPPNASFNSRKLPVVGITQWLFICERLIGAFSFLRANGIIHGDVKPQNILTRIWGGGGGGGGGVGEGSEEPRQGYDWISPDESTTLVEPVVADFSSSYAVDAFGNISDDEDPISAVTTIYCAPELLAAFLTPPTTPTKSLGVKPVNGDGLVPPRRGEPRPLPTFSSDIYGLCMTLLQCAIGSHPYSAAKMDIQRNIWVRQGDPMAFARADERVFRCRVGGAVDRLLKGCFGKTAEGRVEVGELEKRIGGLCEEWRRRNGEERWVWGN
ncbi:hypothetical protein ABW19_dt0210238 [Dactylella cylindrospora]|nr:hypothetical protein ABW19_dt0210238 [Dactylella cylindrospora]